MKYLKTLNVTNNHIVKVYENNSPSNYGWFIATFMRGSKQTLTGTTIKRGTANNEISDLANQQLNLFYKQQLNIM